MNEGEVASTGAGDEDKGLSEGRGCRAAMRRSRRNDKSDVKWKGMYEVKGSEGDRGSRCSEHAMWRWEVQAIEARACT